MFGFFPMFSSSLLIRCCRSITIISIFFLCYSTFDTLTSNHDSSAIISSVKAFQTSKQKNQQKIETTIKNNIDDIDDIDDKNENDDPDQIVTSTLYKQQSSQQNQQGIQKILIQHQLTVNGEFSNRGR